MDWGADLPGIFLDWTVMKPSPYYWQYLPLLMQVAAAFLLGLGMVTASWFVGRHRNTKVKLDTYECGINAVGDARGRFSVRFYLVAVLFILFDIEVVFLYPWAVNFRLLGLFGYVEMVIFIAILFVGYLYIIRKGALKWD